MKIKKQATSRHDSTLSSMIADFVRATESIPLYQLPAHLASFPKHWPFPRGDAYHWIPALNRFDHILDLFNQEYELVDGPQTQPFQRRLLLKGDALEGNHNSELTTTDVVLDTLHVSQDGDRELVEQILGFTRMLLENCGNRSLYSSSERLDKLLNTTSTSLLKATLRLGHRLAQRYHAARMRLSPSTLHPSLLSNHYNVNLDKVQKLSAPFAKVPTVPAPPFSTPSTKGKDKAVAERAGISDRFSGSDLVGMFSLSDVVLRQEFGAVLISYYEPVNPSEEADKTNATEGPATPTPVRWTSSMGPNRTPRQPQSAPSLESPSTPAVTSGQSSSQANGAKTFELSIEKVSSTDIHDLLKQGLACLPEIVHYELLQKLRIAKMLSNGGTGRDDAVAVRLLAISNMGYVHGDKEFHAKLGQQDADEPRRLQLAYQLSELVHPPGNGEDGISLELQTLTLNALEALAKHKTKSVEICAALSVNVNHGVLFYVVRKLVAGLGVETSSPNELEEDRWREALFALLNTLPTAQTRTGEQMVAAGLLEVLVEVLMLRTDKAERNFPKILNFLDTFVYNLRDAFSALVTAKGLEIIADLMQYEVEVSKKLAEEDQGMPKEYKTQLTDYRIPFYNQQSLRWLFKFLNHMMSHTGGNFDRLMRNLIDSPKLLSGLRIVLSNAQIYGSTVWSMAVTILTSFIHNEPTSYQVIAEAGLSDSFLETVAAEPASEHIADIIDRERITSHQTQTYTPRIAGEQLAKGILPVAEAISTLPPAFGAICLAEAGMKLFQSSTALKRFFEIFESPAHIKALDADMEMPTLIGNSFDELVRHHPQLKARVLLCLRELIVRVVQLCADKAEQEGVGAKLWTQDGTGKLSVAGGRHALVGPPTRYELLSASIASATDTEMKDVDEQAKTETANESVTIDQIIETEDSTKGPTTGQYIRVLCRFLSGFFANHAMCAAYIEDEGVESILDISSLACLDPMASENRSMCQEFGRVVQSLVEQKPHIAVPSLVNRTLQSLERLRPMLEHSGKQAFFAPFTSSGESDNVEVLQEGTSYVKALVSAHTLVGAMTLTFQSQMYSTRSAHNVSSQVNLADMYARLVDSLGKLHRGCVWEELLLQRSMPTEWEKETRVKSSGFGNDEADNVFHIGNAPGDTSSSAENMAAPATTSYSATPSQTSAQFKNTQTLRTLLSKIPTEISPFFQSLGKLLLFRRSLESYQRQCATIVGDQLAQAVIDQLEFVNSSEPESTEDRYAYCIVILTSLSQLMIDPNMDRPQALTLLLVSFRNLGGFAVLGSVLHKFYESAIEISKKKAEDRSEESERLLNLSLGGLKIILAFYSQITNFKVIGESQQTSAMQTRPDRDRERADYFITAQFLVELRYEAIKHVDMIWNSNLIDSATTSIMKTSINILKTVLECDGEHGAYKSIDKIPKRNKPIIKPWTPRNGEYLLRLPEFGCPKALVEEALYRCCDNLNMAREYCVSQERPNATWNPIPQYEIQARGPPSASPSRAEVVVPESSADSPRMTADSDTTQEDGESEAPDSQSVQMEGLEGALGQAEAPASNTPTPDTQPAHAIPTAHDVLAYQKRMGAGNFAEPVALDQLDEERSKLRKNLVDRSLDVLNSHEDVTFELADLISAAVTKSPESNSMRAEIGATLVQSLISLQSEDDFRFQGKKIAASAHLLALILQDKHFYEVVVEELKDNFSTLLGFVKIFPDQTPEESSPWIGQVLLIVERLLAEDQLPRQIAWEDLMDRPLEMDKIDPILVPIIGTDEKNQLFDSILEMLPRIGKDESLALSVTRVLVMLTRNRKIAMRLAEKRNIQRLFLMVKQLAGITNEGLRSAFMVVLRHMIEDEAMIRQIMRTDIQQMFETRDRRQTDTTGYTRQMFAHAIRAPEIFVEITNEKLQLARFDPNQQPQTLILKKSESPVPKPVDAAMSLEMTAEEDQPKESSEVPKQPLLGRAKTSDLKVPVMENPDGIIHYLLCELLAYKDVDDKTESPKSLEVGTTEVTAPEAPGLSSSKPESTNPATVAPIEVGKPEKVAFKADAHPIYIYRCFILKCLAELLQSYNRTKIEFINFSRKADPYTVTPSKPRSGVLNYMLTNLVPTGTLNHEGDLSFKKKLATSSCAIDVIVSLCNKTGEYAPPKTDTTQESPYTESETDILFVRKFVMEHALKAFKDASASDEPLDLKYSRLLSIADIFSRMVSQRPNGELLTQNADLTPNLKQMAKIMYEKNFITILTSAIADIDLNFPNAKRVVKYILKPLKWLCFVAMDLSMHYDTSSAPDSADEYEISVASDDDLIDNTREDTPDLFRNSTLGLFEPPHDSESDEDSEDEDDEEIMYDDPYADDIEYEEADIGDDDVISDDEEMLEMDIDGMGPIEGLPGDVDVEIEIDDGGEGMGSDDDSEEDEEDDEDDDDDDDDDDDMEDDDDEDDEDEEDIDDDEAMEVLEALEEVTGDNEGGSLAEDPEGDWSDDQEQFQTGINGDPNMPPGAMGFVLDSPQLLEQMRRAAHMDFLDEDMNQEDEDEEEDFDQEIHYDAGMEDDEDAMPDLGFHGWDEGPAAPVVRHTHRLSPWMFPAGPGDRILVPAYRSHRPGAGPRVVDDGINPLLQRGGRPSGRDGPVRGEDMSDWVHALGGRGARVSNSDSPVSFISNLLNMMSSGTGHVLHQHAGALHLSLNNNLGLPSPFDSGFRREMVRARESHLSRSVREDPHSAVFFTKAYTSQRWQEEARILYGPTAIEKSQRLVNTFLRLMVPAAMDAMKKRIMEREAEAARKIKEDEELREKNLREEAEALQKELMELKETQEREAAEAANAQQQTIQATEETPAASGTQAMEGVEAVEPAVEPDAEPAVEPAVEADPTPAQPPAPRMLTIIRGVEYDITDLGIDAEYLDALPDEMREEVLMQQVAERRQEQRVQQRATAQQEALPQPQAPNAEAANASGDNPTDINEEFLAALPPEIRAELLAQEAQERRRREREENRRRNQGTALVPQGEDMDAANFLASLEPNLRAAVLMDTDEDTLRQLPPEISAEARAYGGDRRLNQSGEVGYRRDGRRVPPDDPTQKKKARPCVQMLDKAGVATLLRLMFIPQQGSAKSSLSSILRYVCENRQNRAEVISILLSILQDGSADVSAVERSFAQLSIRAKQPQQASDKTPKLSRKNGALSINPDVSPLMVVQQCLNTLTQLTEKNPAVWSFFLTEHETGVGLKGRANRKGKAKESRANRFPMNALLTLLDRKLIVESSTIMEQLTTLLRVITAPLQALKKEKEEEAEEAKKSEETAAIENQPTGTPTAVAEQSETRNNVQDTDTASVPEAQTEPIVTEGEGSSSKIDETMADEEKSKKHRALAPPDVPEANLRLVAKILAARECNSKVFQETLSVISNLSPIPGAKEIFGQELLGIAKELATSTLQDLKSLTAQVSKADSPTDVQGIALAKFSPASSDQTKLLRALTALDYLFDPSRDIKDKPETAAEALEPAQRADILLTLHEDTAFAPLWNMLSDCLAVIRQRGNMLNIATTLLPLIESLMVVCKNTTLKELPLSKLVPKEFALSSPPPDSKMENLFFNFTEDHRKILNDLVRQTPKLMSGTFSLLVKNSKVLEFDNKRNYFNRKLHSRGGDRQPHPALQLSVRRDQVFLDSFKSLYFKSADEMKYGKLSIRFHGEEGVDAGGVTREWFQVISRQMFNADYALFVPVASDRTTFHPNRLSSINPEHLMFFKFIGRIIGKALYEGRVLDCHFSRAVYKQIMGKQVNLKDMETLDLEYYKSLEWMLNNDITDIITETFSVEVEAFGEMQVVDLIENGRSIPVTEENKQEYIRLITEHRLTGAVQEQLDHFLKGFHDIVPAELVSIFSEQELELLISGLPDIDVDDWKNNTEYHNYTAASPQIQWFWRAIRTFEKEEQAKLLQFITGTSKVPLNGFKELEGMNGFSKFNIHRDYGSKDRLPSSHTCFNQLDLPEYASYEDLRKALYTAMTAGGEYFGFA